MLKRSTLWIAGLFALVVLTVGCDEDETTKPSGGGSKNGSNIVNITENIEQPTTWSGDSIYVIRKYDFYVSNTLIIEAGTIVKFHPSEGPYCMLSGDGVINAQGSSDDPVIFTSYKDDEHGGDTNGDGDGSSPAPKDWGEINTNDCNGSTFNHCEFYYGGDVGYNATLTLYGSNITVTNCLFAHNDGSYTSAAGDVGVLDASDGSTGTTIQNNIFFDNVRPLSISVEFNLDDSNQFHNPDNPTETNDYNGVFVYTTDHINSNIAWEETEVAMVIDDGDFWVESGYTLTLGNNVVIKFKSDSCLLLADGESALVNHGGTGVCFTSYRDDSRKGDTNNDGLATSPSAGDWIGIFDNSGSIPSPYYFGWSNIYYDSY